MSIVLFNVLGVQAVSTNRIAAELYISPGNLHYHFKTKFDILKAAYEQMEGEITVAIENIRFPLTASNSVDWLVNVLSCLWRYRFFFSGLDFFMQRAPVLLDRYTEFQNWIIQRLAALHEEIGRAQSELQTLMSISY